MSLSIFRIAVINAGLFIILLLCFWFIGMVFAIDAFNQRILILYISGAILQIGINFLIFRKHIVDDWKVLLKVVVVIVIYYMLFVLL